MPRFVREQPISVGNDVIFLSDVLLAGVLDVALALTQFELDPAPWNQLRVDGKAEGIDTKGFTLVISTWWDTSLRSVGFTWRTVCTGDPAGNIIAWRKNSLCVLGQTVAADGRRSIFCCDSLPASEVSTAGGQK